jgi:hypothetical protein
MAEDRISYQVSHLDEMKVSIETSNSQFEAGKAKIEGTQQSTEMVGGAAGEFLNTWNMIQADIVVIGQTLEAVRNLIITYGADNENIQQQIRSQISSA